MNQENQKAFGKDSALYFHGVLDSKDHQAKKHQKQGQSSLPEESESPGKSRIKSSLKKRKGQVRTPSPGQNSRLSSKKKQSVSFKNIASTSDNQFQFLQDERPLDKSNLVIK